MPREKKPKVKSMKPKKSFKETASSLLFAIISLVCAGALFVGLLALENYFAEDITYKEVVVAIAEIPEGEIITEENYATYFGTQNINIVAIPDGALAPADVYELYNQKAIVPISVGEIVLAKDFQNLCVYTDHIENPVEISIAVDSMAASDGGKIRAGDLVNITLMFTEDQLTEDVEETRPGIVIETPSLSVSGNAVSENEVEEDFTPTGYYVENVQNPVTAGSSYNYEAYSQYVLENIYVTKVLASDGTVIEPTDTQSTAAIFIFVIPKEMELELNNALENCSSMRVSRILYDLDVEEGSEAVSENAVESEAEDADAEEDSASEDSLATTEETTPVNTEDSSDSTDESESNQ